MATKLRREIKEDEGNLLFEAIPSLRKIIGGECNKAEDVMHRRHSCDACQHVEEEEGTMPESLESFSEGGSHRLNYLIKRVISVISSIGDPIVCLIDDIQVSSLFLFMFFICNTHTSRHVCFRYIVGK